MSAPGVSDTGDRAGVARNYAYILFGLLFFPLLIVAHFIARKGRAHPEGFEQSHYCLQFRTTTVALLCLLAMVGVALSLFFWLQPSTAFQPVHIATLFSFLNNLVLIAMFWVAVRSIRGLYMCGALRPICNPKTLWLWPR
ncbi:hypothetical protein [Rhizobium sp. GN54]|uniref:hypothetical protein n=1 Tax=Rhizobium sp. GN54 TaxID=2898150 RepID=UPI001E590435|nr:hypothetical protein [Rhizobium sp. GN54]MCD2180735.1 hypothetical protein [Rhizobium sp. GN54]